MIPDEFNWERTSSLSNTPACCRLFGRKQRTKAMSLVSTVRSSASRDLWNWSATPANLEVAPPRVVRWKLLERTNLPPFAAATCGAAAGGGRAVPSSSLAPKSEPTNSRFDFCMSTVRFWLSGSLFLARKFAIEYSTEFAKCFTTKVDRAITLAAPPPRELTADKPECLSRRIEKRACEVCSRSSLASSASSDPFRRMHSSAKRGRTPAGFPSSSSIVAAPSRPPAKSTVATLMPCSAYCFWASTKTHCTNSLCNFSLA
mmetsp:Transcript_40429/g.99868  ORF Transcript_40429/g.99868 Transcript_40429/m.99868 type:complete len:259 (-) Transcript_40429:1452-2228(-)